MVKEMGSWSSNKYKAVKSSAAVNNVRVEYDVECQGGPKPNKDAALAEISNMQQLVNTKKKEKSKSPSPVSSKALPL